MTSPYKRLAERLDALPNGYPATESGIELDLLARLFDPEEADLAAKLRLTPETPAEVAARLGMEAPAARKLLKGMARRGLIEIHRTDAGLAYGLMPFVVGIYEMQIGRLDAELAQLFETYYVQAFGEVLRPAPQLHRVIPVGEAVPVAIEVSPFESAAAIVDNAQAWGVVDCICRKQKALIGEACEHPLDVCMVFSTVPGAFDNTDKVRAQTHEESLATLRRASEAGLVHTVGNTQEGHSYICNCCTCSCGILRGIADLGVANVVASSAFVASVDRDACIACEECTDACQFGALALDEGIMAVDARRCVGCGQCVLNCSQDSLILTRRPDDAIKPIPATMRDWQQQRAMARGQDLNDVL